MRTINGRESSVLCFVAQIAASDMTKEAQYETVKSVLADIQPFVHETALVLLGRWEEHWLEPMEGVLEMVDYMRSWVIQIREEDEFWANKSQKQ